MNYKVNVINDHKLGASDIHIGGAGVICRLPFDKFYLMPEIQKIVETAALPVDWPAVKSKCQETIDSAKPKPSPTDPKKFDHID